MTDAIRRPAYIQPRRSLSRSSLPSASPRGAFVPSFGHHRDRFYELHSRMRGRRDCGHPLLQGTNDDVPHFATIVADERQSRRLLRTAASTPCSTTHASSSPLLGVMVPVASMPWAPEIPGDGDMR